jgi:hypothetical protein
MSQQVAYIVSLIKILHHTYKKIAELRDRLTHQQLQIRGVQNRTNPIGKPHTELIQIETAKNHIWFGCIQIIFFTQLHGLVWFAVLILPTEPNQTKPRYKKNTN